MQQDTTTLVIILTFMLVCLFGPPVLQLIHDYLNRK